jgi:DNA-binding NtrC family response regulator
VRTYPLPANTDVRIGRAEDNHVRIDNPSVSRYHAVLRAGPRTTIRDLGGTNGILLHAGEVAGGPDTLGLKRLLGESADVAVGESIMLGGVTLVIRRAAPLADFSTSTDDQVVHDPRTKALYQDADLAARSTISVLILGESGVGKEVLARYIHARSKRAAAPFMGINCAGLSGTLLEGELFGYERGAFTGAVQARPGLFEAASGGTVFLDELGELPLDTQAKLLRMIEEKAVMRIGARHVRPIDVRFVCATNKNLDEDVRDRKFRPDLFYRVAGITLNVPPLRERPADLEPLIRRFLQQQASQLDRTSPPVISPEALQRLRQYSWPGNVRELRNVLERCVVLRGEGIVRPEDLPPEIYAPPRHTAITSSVPISATHERASSPDRTTQPDRDPYLDRSSDSPVREELKQFERNRIIEALARCHGNQSEAAKLLGMSRRTLVARLSEFNLPRPRKGRAGE